MCWLNYGAQAFMQCVERLALVDQCMDCPKMFLGTLVIFRRSCENNDLDSWMIVGQPFYKLMSIAIGEMEIQDG